MTPTIFFFIGIFLFVNVDVSSMSTSHIISRNILLSHDRIPNPLIDILHSNNLIRNNHPQVNIKSEEEENDDNEEEDNDNDEIANQPYESEQSDKADQNNKHSSNPMSSLNFWWILWSAIALVVVIISICLIFKYIQQQQQQQQQQQHKQSSSEISNGSHQSIKSNSNSINDKIDVYFDINQIDDSCVAVTDLEIDLDLEMGFQRENEEEMVTQSDFSELKKVRSPLLISTAEI